MENCDIFPSKNGENATLCVQECILPPPFFVHVRKNRYFCGGICIGRCCHLLCVRIDLNLMTLSIIVPVYNVEHFLRRCLDSLLRQGLEVGEYEIICVNDGSSDGSAAILADYEQRFPDLFRIITQQNQGVGAARNAGMAVARGEYIAFVDGDDWLIDGGYAYLLEHFCQEGNPDVISFWSVTMNNYQMHHWVYSDKPDGEVYFEGEGVKLYNQGISPFVWEKFYRRAFLVEHGVLFTSIPLAEDILFNFHVFCHNPRAKATSSNIYRYSRDNEVSAIAVKTRASSHRKMEGLLLIMNEMHAYLAAGDTPMEPGIRNVINTLLQTFYTRSFTAGFSRREWQHYMGTVKDMAHHTVRLGGKWAPVGIAMNLSRESYVVYRVVSFLYIKVFGRYVHHRLG